MKHTYGNILNNSNKGIYGIYEEDISNLQTVKVAEPKMGKAYIRTVISNQNVEEYEINITGINENSDTKNIILEITDQNLIDKTGGVVQGMSGSPIMQDGNIVGVLTHVVVDKPVKGYGILITNMLKEGDKILSSN